MRFQMEIDIKAPAEEAWKVLGEGFGTIAEWSCNLTTSSLDGDVKVGAIRTCVSANSFGPFKAGSIQERLVAYDPLTMTFAYEAVSGLPGFMSHAGNRWSIHKVDGQNCVVRFDARAEVRGMLKLLGPLIEPLMKLMMKADLNRFAEEVRYRLAEGRPHPRKLGKKEET